VQEGRVAVAATSPDGTLAAAVELSAGQRAATMAGRAQLLPIRSVSADQVGAWRTGGFSALDESLDAVLSELARRSALEITHAPDVDGTATVSLFYPEMPSVDTVLNDLCTAQGLTLTRTSRGFHITRSGARS
jgi:ferric-dicitrate binding protein FerR (iron transport regulator)